MRYYSLDNNSQSSSPIIPVCAYEGTTLTVALQQMIICLLIHRFRNVVSKPHVKRFRARSSCGVKRIKLIG